MLFLTVLLANWIAQTSGTNCSIAHESKVDCAFAGITQQQCQQQLDCCYEPVTKQEIPWCFYSNKHKFPIRKFEICEHNPPNNLTCNSTDYIQVLNGFFGYYSGSKCHVNCALSQHPSCETCTNPKARDIASDMCNGNSSCLIDPKAEKWLTKTSCDNFNNLLAIDYMCIPKEIDSTIIATLLSNTLAASNIAVSSTTNLSLALSINRTQSSLAPIFSTHYATLQSSVPSMPSAKVTLNGSLVVNTTQSVNQKSSTTYEVRSFNSTTSVTETFSLSASSVMSVRNSSSLMGVVLVTTVNGNSVLISQTQVLSLTIQYLDSTTAIKHAEKTSPNPILSSSAEGKAENKSSNIMPLKTTLEVEFHGTTVSSNIFYTKISSNTLMMTAEKSRSLTESGVTMFTASLVSGATPSSPLTSVPEVTSAEVKASMRTLPPSSLQNTALVATTMTLSTTAKSSQRNVTPSLTFSPYTVSSTSRGYEATKTARESKNVITTPLQSTIVGTASLQSKITTSTGSMMVSPSTGRVVGSPSTGSVMGSPSTGIVMGSPSTGRVVGSPSTGSVMSSPSTGRVVGSPSTGRVVGSPSTGRVVGSPSTGSVMSSPSSSSLLSSSVIQPVTTGGKGGRGGLSSEMKSVVGVLVAVFLLLIIAFVIFFYKKKLAKRNFAYFDNFTPVPGTYYLMDPSVVQMSQLDSGDQSEDASVGAQSPPLGYDNIGLVKDGNR